MMIVFKMIIIVIAMIIDNDCNFANNILINSYEQETMSWYDLNE